MKTRKQTTEIIIHCTATREGRDYTVEDITRWHRQRGFKTIGYHYVIYRDGTVLHGRDEHLWGAHCTGHNDRSVGIAYVGGLSSDGRRAKDTRTVEQRSALLRLLLQLKLRYPLAVIHSHRDFTAKACPSFDATTEYASLSS